MKPLIRNPARPLMVTETRQAAQYAPVAPQMLAQMPVQTARYAPVRQVPGRARFRPGLRGLGAEGDQTGSGLGELQAVGWVLTGAAIGWASSAYSTGRALETAQLLAAWGGASAGVILLGVRRLTNGDQSGLAPSLLGLALGGLGFYFGRSQRATSSASAANAKLRASTWSD